MDYHKIVPDIESSTNNVRVEEKYPDNPAECAFYVMSDSFLIHLWHFTFAPTSFLTWLCWFYPSKHRLILIFVFVLFFFFAVEHYIRTL